MSHVTLPPPLGMFKIYIFIFHTHFVWTSSYFFIKWTDTHKKKLCVNKNIVSIHLKYVNNKKKTQNPINWIYSSLLFHWNTFSNKMNNYEFIPKKNVAVISKHRIDPNYMCVCVVHTNRFSLYLYRSRKKISITRFIC